VCYPLPNGGFELPVSPVCVTPYHKTVVAVNAPSARVTEGAPIKNTLSLPNGGFDSFEHSDMCITEILIQICAHYAAVKSSASSSSSTFMATTSALAQLTQVPPRPTTGW